MSYTILCAFELSVSLLVKSCSSLVLPSDRSRLQRLDAYGSPNDRIGGTVVGNERQVCGSVDLHGSLE